MTRPQVCGTQAAGGPHPANGVMWPDQVRDQESRTGPCPQGDAGPHARELRHPHLPPLPAPYLCVLRIPGRAQTGHLGRRPVLRVPTSCSLLTLKDVRLLLEKGRRRLILVCLPFLDEGISLKKSLIFHVTVALK